MRRELLLAAMAAVLASPSFLMAQGKPAVANTAIQKASARPCKYETLWIDPAGDGSPEGRNFSASIKEKIAKSNKLRLVEKKDQAQVTFSNNKVSSRRDPTFDTSVDCTSDADSTDCYSADYHSHADSNGSSTRYVGPYDYTYEWQLVDTKTFLLLNSGLDVPIDLKHPRATAGAILKELGCGGASRGK